MQLLHKIVYDVLMLPKENKSQVDNTMGVVYKQQMLERVWRIGNPLVLLVGI